MRPNRPAFQSRRETVIKSTDNDGRLEPGRPPAHDSWNIVVADPADARTFAAALADADAIVSMNWSGPTPFAPRLRLVQLPGAGTDDIDFSAVPARGVCRRLATRSRHHQIRARRDVLEWLVGLRRMDAEFREHRWFGS